MVLPPPAAPDREGPGDAGWLERITRVLYRTAKGVVILCDGAGLGRLRDLVVALCQAELPPEVVGDAAELADIPAGSVVVLAAQARHAAWLNLNRPVLSERAIRLVLFSDERTTAALRADAPDVFDWISHRVGCPPLAAAPHAVLGLRAALRARATGVVWWGSDLAATFAAALPERPLLETSAVLSEAEMTGVLRAAGRAWTAWSDVDSRAALDRLRRAQDTTRRRTRLILVRPRVVPPDFWPVHDRFTAVAEACAMLRAAGAISPGRLAALAGMEPEAIELAAEQLRAGAAQETLERGMVEQQDPGAWLAEGAARSIVPAPPQWRAGQRPARAAAMTDPRLGQWRRQTSGAEMRQTAAIEADRLKDAEHAYEPALPLQHAAGDRLGEANVLQAFGDLSLRTDRLKDAEHAYAQALPLYRAIDDRLGEANVLRAMGDLSVRTDRFSDAERFYGQALSTFRAIDGRLGEANTWTALGDLYVRTDRFKDAEQCYEQALPLYRAIDDRLGEAGVLTSMGNLALVQGHVASAFARLLEALALHRNNSDTLGIAAAHGYLARASLAAGRPARAAILGSRAVQMLRAIDDRFGQMLALVDMARAFTGLGKTEAANAALLLAAAHAAAVERPLAQQMAEQAGNAGLPAAEDIEKAEAIVGATLADLEQDLRATAEDPYAPLALP